MGGASLTSRPALFLPVDYLKKVNLSENLAIIRTGSSIVTVILAAWVILVAGALTVAITIPEIGVNVSVDVDEGLLASWHKDHESETAEDWLGPFLLRGENASITWVMKDGAIGPGEEAQLCTAVDRSCLGPSVVVAQQIEFNLHDGGLPEEGWYYLYYSGATGQLKSVVIYLYY